MDELDIQTPGEEPEFTLEDILREFGSRNDDGRVHDLMAPELMEDEPQRELVQDIPQRELVKDIPLSESSGPREEPDLLIWTPRQKPELPSTDTIRIDTEQVKVRTAKTAGMEDTRAFPPVTESSTPESFRTNPIPQEAEPFSENWEPQYDQPIGDYTPPEPIIFRPRSRLGELKRKLMDGPEQRYNALSEKGVGKLQIALFFSMLIVVLAVASIVLHRLGMVRENRMRLLVFGELFAMLMSALLCWERLTDGVLGMFRGRFHTDTLLAFSFAACIADGLYCLQEVRLPFCAAFCLESLMCLWSEYQKRSTELCQMDTLRKATRLSRISKAPNCYDGRPGFRASDDGQPEDFMDTYDRPSGPQKALDRFALAALVVSVLVALAAGYHSGLRAGVRTWSAAILAACPATMLICQTRPAWTLQRRLHRLGAVICGWQGIRTAAGRAVVPVSGADLLPAGSVKINGVKNYTSRNPDTVLAYATAIMVRSGNCLAPLFEERLRSHRAQSYEIDEFKTYGNQGLGAIICGERVLVGSQEFLRNMGIKVDPGAQVNQAVYIAIDDEFVGLFALAFGKLKGVSSGLSAMCAQRRLTPVLASTNFVLDEQFIRSKFRADPRRIIFPSAEDRKLLAHWQPQESSVCALTTQEGLAATAHAITGARSLRTASIAGAAAHIISGLVGLAIVALLTMSGRTDLMTPANLLLLELIWSVPGLMISEWTR